MKIFISPCGNILYRSDVKLKVKEGLSDYVELKEPTKKQINDFFKGVKVTEKKGKDFNYYNYDNATFYSVFCNEHKIQEYSKRFNGSTKRLDITEQEYKSNLKEYDEK